MKKKDFEKRRGKNTQERREERGEKHCSLPLSPTPRQNGSLGSGSAAAILLAAAAASSAACSPALPWSSSDRPARMPAAKPLLGSAVEKSAGAGGAAVPVPTG